MRKVFLEDLPKRGKYVSWIDSIDMRVNFVYDEVEGEIDIVDYKKSLQELHIKHNNNIFKIHTSDFQKAKLGGQVLGIYRYERKVS